MDFVWPWGLHTDIVANCNDNTSSNNKFNMNSVFNNCFGQMDQVIDFDLGLQQISLQFGRGETSYTPLPSYRPSVERGADIIEYPLVFSSGF